MATQRRLIIGIVIATLTTFAIVIVDLAFTVRHVLVRARSALPLRVIPHTVEDGDPMLTG